MRVLQIFCDGYVLITSRGFTKGVSVSETSGEFVIFSQPFLRNESRPMVNKIFCQWKSGDTKKHQNKGLDKSSHMTCDIQSQCFISG